MKRLNELYTDKSAISYQTVLDILFDMGAKIMDAKHSKSESEIIIEYNNQTATLYFFYQSKKIQIVQGDILMKSVYKIQNTDDLIKVLTSLLKRIF
jgi:hypothetical protein